MKQNSANTLAILGITVATVALIIGAVFGMSKIFGGSKEMLAVDRSILINADHYRYGPENAQVEIVEFSDFECPACSASAPFLKKLVDQNPERISITFRNYPLSFHPKSREAAMVVLAAGKQGKFWEMHDLLFANQKVWAAGNQLEVDHFEEYAVSLDLDIEQFNSDRNDPELASKIESDQADGNRAGVSATPTFFINGKMVVGFGSVEFNKILEEELNQNN